MEFGAVIVENRHELAKQAIKKHEPFLKGFRIIHAKDHNIYNGTSYNETLTNPDFWNALKNYHRVLIFQHDSGLLKAIPKEFFNYDYVGAPWKFQHHGGNGGLSLRNPRTMIDILKRHKWTGPYPNEDVWFCNIMHSEGLKLAPRDVCSRFSVESIFKLGTVGYHQMETHLTKDQINQILNQYKKY